MRKPLRPKPLCVYCDAAPAMTRDHVVPQCLFNGKLTLDMVTVRVCKSCNAAKKADDEYLRDYLAIHEANFDHPVAKSLFERMRRATRRNQSEVARAVVANTDFRPAYTADGVPVGNIPFVPLDQDRMVRLFSRITRGLYFRLRHRRFPQDEMFAVNWIEQREADNIQRSLSAVGIGHYCLGDVFGCLHAYDEAEPSKTIWLQRYFNVWILVRSAPAGSLLPGEF